MDLTLLATPWLGTPLYLWLAFLSLVGLLLAFDLGVLHRKSEEISIRQSLVLSGGYIVIGLTFGAFVWWHIGAESGLAYLTGFVIEKTLALDNIFVIALIFSFFGIPRRYQHRALFWGILGVIVLRGIMIGAGATLVAEFHWILYLFGAFLLFTGIKMWWAAGQEPDLESNPALKLLRKVLPVSKNFDGEKFFTVENGKRIATPLLLVIALVGITDVIFAVDSIPAIFAITSDPFIVLTSNIFAILGLRAMYFLLAAMASKFHLLSYGLAVILAFIGTKMLLIDIVKIPVFASLGAVIGILALTMWLSVRTAPKLPASNG